MYSYIIVRKTGDVIHLVAILLLLGKLIKTKSCSGVSGKSQLLLCMVFLTRYMDLFTTYISLYNFMGKVIFLITSMITVFLIFGVFKKTYEHERDTFRIEYLITTAVILSIFLNYDFALLEILWTFSIYLEALAMLPQFHLLKKVEKINKVMKWYLGLQCLYRFMYFLNWNCKYLETGSYDLITIISGVIQITFYGDFFLHRVIGKTKKSNATSAILESVEPSDECKKLNNMRYPEEKIHTPIQKFDTKEMHKMIADLLLPMDNKKKTELLDAIAQTGQISDFTSIDGTAQNICQCFDSESKDVQSAASRALGNISATNIQRYLPTILKEIEANPQRQHLPLLSLEIALKTLSTKAEYQLISVIPLIWSNFLELCGSSDDEIRRILINCFKILFIANKDNDDYLLMSINMLLHSKNVCQKTFAVQAMQYIVPKELDPNNIAQKECIEAFLLALDDPEPVVKCNAMATLNKIFCERPNFASNVLPKMLVAINLKPITYKTNKYKYILTIVQLAMEPFDITEVLDQVELGLRDDLEIKMFSCLIIAELTRLHPYPLLLKYVPLLQMISEQHLNDEIMEPITKAVRALISIPNAEKNETLLKLLSTIEANSA